MAVHKAEFIVDIHNPEGAGQAEERIQYVMPYDLSLIHIVNLIFPKEKYEL